MIRQKLQQFMYGRNGGDQLSLVTLWASVLLQLISSFADWHLLYYLALIPMGYTLFRMFSRKVEKRRAENARFLAAVRPIRRKICSVRTHMKDREHHYFRCPNCKQQMRVPRGKGRIQVTCRSCGVTFEEKS